MHTYVCACVSVSVCVCLCLSLLLNFPTREPSQFTLRSKRTPCLTSHTCVGRTGTQKITSPSTQTSKRTFFMRARLEPCPRLASCQRFVNETCGTCICLTFDVCVRVCVCVCLSVCLSVRLSVDLSTSRPLDRCAAFLFLGPFLIISSASSSWLIGSLQVTLKDGTKQTMWPAHCVQGSKVVCWLASISPHPHLSSTGPLG